MDLRQGRNSPVLEALNEPRLPQRSGAIKWAGHQTADELIELAPSPRRGHRDPPEMKAEVKLGVLDEPWPVKAKRRPGHPVAQRRQLRKASSEKISDRTEGEIRRLRRITDPQGAAVQRTVARLGEPKCRIQARQPFHVERVTRSRPH